MDHHSSQKILVVGATGFVGPSLVEECLNAGFQVICGVRNLKKAKKQLNFPGIKFVEVDLNIDTDPTVWLDRLRKFGIDGIINNVGIANPFGNQSLENVNVRAPLALFKAAELYQEENRRGGEELEKLRIIQVSTTGVSWPDCDRFDYPRTKKMTDEALSRMKNLNFVIVRPNIIYEPARGHLVLEQIARLPVIFYLGHAGIQPIHCRELAIGITRLLQKPYRASQMILQASGPEVMTWKEVFRQSREALGRPSAFYFRVPLLLGQLFTLLIQQLPDKFLYSLGILSKMDVDTITMMTKGSTGSNHGWLEQTRLYPIRLSETYKAVAQGPEDYAKFLEKVRRDYITYG